MIYDLIEKTMIRSKPERKKVIFSDDDKDDGLGDLFSKLVIFVSDCKLNDSIRASIRRLDVEEFDKKLYLNIPVQKLIDDDIKALWVYSDKSGASWLSKNNISTRTDVTRISVYSHNKNQKYIKQISPDIVVRKSKLNQLMSISLQDLKDGISAIAKDNEIHASVPTILQYLGCGSGGLTKKT